MASKPRINKRKSDATGAAKTAATRQRFVRKEGPELVFAVVGAVGTDLRQVCDVLARELGRVGYVEPSRIRLSDLLRKLGPYRDIPLNPPEIRTELLMDAGDDLRSKLKSGDAMALLGIANIRRERIQLSKARDKPVKRHAYILHSLKHPSEVRTLRLVYGRAFYLIAAFSPRDSRISLLADRFSEGNSNFDKSKYREIAERLVNRDESDSTKRLGQDVRDTYPLADFFLTATSQDEISRQIERFVDIIFGYPYHTPSIDESGMFYARATALRSADLSRQVGAVITTQRGEILAAGCNDVPQSGGGDYWPELGKDNRDFKKGFDPSAQTKRRIVSELFDRLKSRKWLSEKILKKEVETITKQAIYSGPSSILKSAQVMSLLEFGRVVHAEMAAISEAARRGISVKGATLYCTTFPCHNCARHIVSAGIARVVYIEPYPKSMAEDLYRDEINVLGDEVEDKVNFVPFIGISPNQYINLFSMNGDRKKDDGTIVEWKAATAEPRLERMVWSYLEIEDEALGFFDKSKTALKGKFRVRRGGANDRAVVTRRTRGGPQANRKLARVATPGIRSRSQASPKNRPRGTKGAR